MSETVMLAGWEGGFKFADVGLALLLRSEGILLVGS